MSYYTAPPYYTPNPVLTSVNSGLNSIANVTYEFNLMIVCVILAIVFIGLGYAIISGNQQAAALAASATPPATTTQSNYIPYMPREATSLGTANTGPYGPY